MLVELIMAILLLFVGIKLIAKPMPSFGIEVAEKIVRDATARSESRNYISNRYSTPEITIYLLRECSTTSLRGLAHDFHATRRNIEEILDKMGTAYACDPAFIKLFQQLKVEFEKETGGRYKARKF